MFGVVLAPIIPLPPVPPMPTTSNDHLAPEIARPVRETPSHLDIALAFIIAECGDSPSRASWRLNAFENIIALLAGHRRAAQPISPVRELHMSRETLDVLLAWIEAEDTAVELTRARLAVYASGVLTDESVAGGWVRVAITPERTSP
jgi:hypothetical protein